MKLLLISFFCLIPLFLQAQKFSNKDLKRMNGEELLVLFDEAWGDTLKGEKIMNIYLDRAKYEYDTLKIVRGLSRLTSISNSEKSLALCERIIYLTLNMDDENYPAIGYILMGSEYYKLGNLKLSTENFILANKLALKNKNITQQIFIADVLINLKTHWGNKKDALALQMKRHQLVTKEVHIKDIKKSVKERTGNSEVIYIHSVITSMQNFVECYINLKELDSASLYLEKGLEQTATYSGFSKPYFQDWFATASIKIDWYAKNYKKVIITSNQLLPTINMHSEYSSESIVDVYFFTGFSHIKLNEYEKGIEYLKKADSVFEHKKTLMLPYHRDLFEELLMYHKSKNDTEMKIKYLNKLLAVDSIFKRNYQFFEPNLIKNYETPQLLKEKETLIASLKKKNEKFSTTNWWLIALLGASIFTFMLYIKRQLIYKKRFENLMQTQEFPKSENVEITENKHEISSKIVEDILSHLNDFEINKEFLEQKISLRSLAASFGTNHTYLSKVINLEKKKHFTVYISDLRIEYVFDEIKNNQKLRKYTIKAIAAEIGFSSAESFSKAFYKKYEIYPSFYIKGLIAKNSW